VGHGLAPVTHHEFVVNFGGGLKFFERLFVPERVEGGHPAEEMLLRLGRARRREIHRPEVGRLRGRARGREHDGEGGENSEGEGHDGPCG
jgi:hypothetical protein